jgi:hypothetical protein
VSSTLDAVEKPGATASIILLYAALALLTVPVFPHFLSPNEFSRWIVAAAIVDYHTLEVTPVNARFGGRIEDLARIDGRTYSNKAPGVALVGLPAYAVVRAVAGPAQPSTSRITLTAMRWIASTLPTLILAWMMLRAGRRLGVSEPVLRWVLAVLLFATPLFAYGTLLFSHALTAFALFGAWTLLFTDTFGRRPALAGALMGLAVLSEYTSAVVLALFLICAAIWSRREVLPFIAGGLPLLGVFLLYNYLAFGSPFNLSYTYTEHADYRALARSGLFGLHAPSISTLASLLFDPSRGLLVLSPILLCALSAWSAREHLSPPAFWSIVGTPLVLLFVFAGYPYWHGGWGVGARYLVPALPFVVFLLAFAEISFGASVLMGMSMTAVVMVSLVFPFVPPNAFPLPWGSLAWPILRDGLVAPNLLHFVARPLAILVPFAIVLAVAAIGVPRRWWIGFAAGSITTLAIGILYANSTPSMLMARAYIEEVYFDQHGTLNRKLPGGVTLQPSLLAHLRSELESPPPTWPF